MVLPLKPEIVQEVVTVVQLCPPLEVPMYSVIAEPPVTSGACHETSADS